MEERIVRAAIRLGDAVFSVPQPGRHHDVIQIMARRPEHCPSDAVDQGFLTSEGRYVGRIEARDIAGSARQIIRTTGAGRGELFSEDVW